MEAALDASLDARVRLLERRLRATRALTFVALLLAIGMGALALWPRGELRAKRFVVVDDAGVERAKLGLGDVDLPDFFMGGSFHGEGVALVLTDALGRARQIVGVGGGKKDASMLAQLDEVGERAVTIAAFADGMTDFRLGSRSQIALHVTATNGKDGDREDASLSLHGSGASRVHLEASHHATVEVASGSDLRAALTAHADPSGSVELDLESGPQSVQLSSSSGRAASEERQASNASLYFRDRDQEASILLGIFGDHSALSALRHGKAEWGSVQGTGTCRLD